LADGLDLVGTPDAGNDSRLFFNDNWRETCLRLTAGADRDVGRRDSAGGLWRQARDVAIDFQRIGLLRQQSQVTGLWVRGQARDAQRGSYSGVILRTCAEVLAGSPWWWAFVLRPLIEDTVQGLERSC